MLVFLDLESTGLDPDRCHVLEVAAIITDDSLAEITRYERVLYWPSSTFHLTPAGLAESWLDPIVTTMHEKSGLWIESAASPHMRKSVDQELALFIAQHCEAVGEKSGPQLAGNTISFDRAFLKVHLPMTHATLHYRNLDVTSFNEMSRRFWPEVYAGRPRASNAAHRAMADCAESLECARYYARMLGSLATPVLTHAEHQAIRTADAVMNHDHVAAFTRSVRNTLDELIARAAK